MRRLILTGFLQLVVILLAVGFYLYFLPIQVTQGTNGISVTFPIFIRLVTAQPGVDPVHWNYVLLLPISLLILFIGFELIKLVDRR